MAQQAFVPKTLVVPGSISSTHKPELSTTLVKCKIKFKVKKKVKYVLT